MTNSVAVVMGASQGIGRSTAVRLARDFGSIVPVARNRAKKPSSRVPVRVIALRRLSR
jgi:3-oxoacyl-[acyl-carrier protein] reductase